MAVDYGGAVANGSVTSASEYAEMNEFAAGVSTLGAIKHLWSESVRTLQSGMSAYPRSWRLAKVVSAESSIATPGAT